MYLVYLTIFAVLLIAIFFIYKLFYSNEIFSLLQQIENETTKFYSKIVNKPMNQRCYDENENQKFYDKLKPLFDLFAEKLKSIDVKTIFSDVITYPKNLFQAHLLQKILTNYDYDLIQSFIDEQTILVRCQDEFCDENTSYWNKESNKCKCNTDSATPILYYDDEYFEENPSGPLRYKCVNEVEFEEDPKEKN